MMPQIRVTHITKSVLVVLLFLYSTRVFSQTLPVPSHIVVVIMENTAYSEVIGTPGNAPHINAIASDTNAALFTQSYAIEHPSQPNYLDMFSGSNQGVTDDNLPTGTPYTTANLGAQLIGASKSFACYSEDLPSVGYNGATSGNYARKHNAAANWMGTGTNQLPTTVDQPLSAFPVAANYGTLPTFCYVVPNLNDDMHNGSYPTRITLGDTWLYQHMDSLRQWSLSNNTLLVITFDEDNDSSSNHITTIFYGPMVKGGQYSNHVDHYNMLRTFEDMYGLGHAGNAASSTAITYCWKPNLGICNISKEQLFSVFPNPANGVVNISSQGPISEPVNIVVTNTCGQNVGNYLIKSLPGSFNTTEYPNGVYYYKISGNSGIREQGKFVVMH